MQIWLEMWTLEIPPLVIYILLQVQQCLAMSTLQKVVSLSTTGEEYIVAMEDCKEMVWME